MSDCLDGVCGAKKKRVSTIRLYQLDKLHLSML